MHNKNIIKKKLLASLKKYLGIVSTACAEANLSRSVYYKYMKEDADFRAEVEDIQECALDFVESNLLKKIKDGDTACIIFYLKTKGRDRGFIEKVEQQTTIIEHKKSVDQLFPPEKDLLNG